jgi:hypothetical protein
LCLGPAPVAVHDGAPLLLGADQDDRGLRAAEGLQDPRGVLGRTREVAEPGLDRPRQLDRRRHQDRGRERVVLGLADEVERHVSRVRGVVGEDRDLRGAGLGVDAHGPADEPLRGRDEDVPRAGDDVDGLAQRLAVLGLTAGRPVGEHPDGLATAGGVDLVDAEQCACREDRRVRQPTVVRLGRGGDGQAGDTGLLRGDDVHDDGRGVDRATARHVEADPPDGDPPLFHDGTGRDRRRVLGGDLVGVDRAHAPDRLGEARPHGGVEGVERLGERGRRDTQMLRTHPVEALGQVPQRGGAAGLDVVEDRGDGRDGLLHPDLGAREHPEQLRAGQVAPAKVDALDHVPSLGGGLATPDRRPAGGHPSP